MSGGLFGWIGEGVAEIGNQFNKVFTSDDAPGSNSGETQARTPSINQKRGSASYEQGENWERYTEQKLSEFGLKANWYSPEELLLYDETLEKYGKCTQVEITIDDANENEVAIVECKCYGPNSKFTGAKAVDQVQRLIHVANERGVYLVFSTADGTTDCFGSDVKEVLNKTQCFVISSDDLFFADPSDIKETGITSGLPPELRDHSDGGGGGGGEGEALLGGLISSFFGFFGSSSDPESSVTSDNSKSDSENSSDSWFGNLFGDNSDSYSDNVSGDDESGDYRDSGDSDNGSNDSWFGNWFGGSSDSYSDNVSGDDRSGDYGDSGDSDNSSSSSDSYDSDYGSNRPLAKLEYFY